jgi:hypothetical protein
VEIGQIGKMTLLAAIDSSYPVVRSNTQLGVGDDVRILRGTFARLAKIIWRYAQTDEGKYTFKNIRFLREHWEPEVVAKEKSSRSRPATVAKGACRPQATDGSWQMPLQ